MGSGKTFNVIEEMKASNDPFLYVTPFLSEVDRIKANVKNVQDPKTFTNKNLLGEQETVYKRGSLLKMASQGNNLATTHSLFSKLHKQDYRYFKNHKLILDEVINPIKVIDMKPDDITIGFNEGLLFLDEETGEVSYTGERYKGRFYADLKQDCDTKNVIYVNNRLLVWAFPPEIFESFKSVKVLTYLFEGSLLSYYFKYYNIQYEVVKEDKSYEIELKRNIKELLNIYEGPCNKHGERMNAFSINWLKNLKPKNINSIKSCVANLLIRVFRTNSNDTIFTTAKNFKDKLKGKGYSKGFIVMNERATNKYANKSTMVYLINRYLKPAQIDFFRSRNIEVDENLWALSEMLQWIWRGCIRNNEPMNLYIPSKRMRTLLVNWINNEI